MDILTALYLQWLIITLYRTFSKEQQIQARVGWQETWAILQLSAPFNNLRTLKFKAQPTTVFFATVNQMFGSGS